MVCLFSPLDMITPPAISFSVWFFPDKVVETGLYVPSFSVCVF